MQKNEKKKIDYQFVPGPHSLLYALDNDCWKALCVLIDKENYWKSRNKVFQGYFTLSVEELSNYLGFRNKQDTRLVLEALYRARIVDVKAVNGKRLGEKVKLNFDLIKNEEFDYVEKLPRGTTITYCADQESLNRNTKCTPTLNIEQRENRLEKDIETEKDIEKKENKVDIDSLLQNITLSNLDDYEREEDNNNNVEGLSYFEGLVLKEKEKEYRERYLNEKYGEDNRDTPW